MDTVDRREWLYNQSDDAVVAEFCQMENQLIAANKPLEEAEGLLGRSEKLSFRIVDAPNIYRNEKTIEYAQFLFAEIKAFRTTPTNPDKVLVRRDYAEQILSALEKGTIEHECLKDALEKS